MHCTAQGRREVGDKWGQRLLLVLKSAERILHVFQQLSVVSFDLCFTLFDWILQNTHMPLQYVKLVNVNWMKLLNLIKKQVYIIFITIYIKYYILNKYKYTIINHFNKINYNKHTHFQSLFKSISCPCIVG